MGDVVAINFGIGGMNCASCVGRVETALGRVEGVQDARVNLASETASLQVAPGFDPKDAVAALATAGYPATVQTRRYAIENMSCASCVGRVERALATTAGVVSVNVNLASEEAVVEALGQSASQVAQAATDAGYPARAISDQSKAEATEDRKAQQATLLRRNTLIAAVLTAPVFILEMGGHAIPAVHAWVMDSLGVQLSCCLLYTSDAADE